MLYPTTKDNGVIGGLLANLPVPRCYLSDRLGSQFENTQLHIFADVSQVAFYAAAYWRFETCDHSCQCAFVFGKVRRAPVKPCPFPRLELQAAVMAVRMGQTTETELDINPNQIPIGHTQQLSYNTSKAKEPCPIPLWLIESLK